MFDVGGLAGDASGTETTHTSTNCSFRVMLNSLPLVYQGKEDDWNDKAYQKCTMLHPGDEITVRIFRYCSPSSHGNRFHNRSYEWKSGPTTGRLL